MLLEVTGTDGVTVTHEVSAGARQAPDAAAATIGLTLAEGKSTLGILQYHLIRMQAAAHCEERRLRERCGVRRPIKDRRSRRLMTLFGAVEVDALRSLRCGVARPGERSVRWPSSCRTGVRPNTNAPSPGWVPCCPLGVP